MPKRKRTPLHPAHPSLWPTWIGVGLLRLLCLLPKKLQSGLGNVMGRLLCIAQPTRVHIAKRNIELCFPNLNSNQQENLLTQHIKALGYSFFEFGHSWWDSDEEILSQTDFMGEEHLKKALESGRGVILLTAHFTSMEIGAHIMGAKFQTSAMYRKLKNPIMDRLVLNARSRRMDPVFERRDVRSMLQCLKNGKAIWYGFDQNYSHKHSIFVPFFGIEASTITATSRFAKASGSLVVPFFPYRQENGRYLMEIHPALNDFPSGDMRADTARLNQLLEIAIEKAPEQYFWIHRRFKTRPEGETSVY